MLREPNEYGSAVAADLFGVPHARVGIGLAAVEGAAGTVSELQRSVGLGDDPESDRIRRSPYLALFPESFEAPGEAVPPHTLRFRDPAGARSSAPLPDWWGGDTAPLVYVTFGSVAGAIPKFGSIYATALEALAELPVRCLLTLGAAAADELGPVPPNVHVASWVPQADIFGSASAVVCDGGSGTTPGALAAKLPLVIVPLFADQPYNAERVAALGAGLAIEPEAGALARAIETVLGNESFRSAAGRLAAEMRRLPPTDQAFDALSGARG